MSCAGWIQGIKDWRETEIKTKSKTLSNLLAIYCMTFKFKIMLKMAFAHHKPLRIQSIFLNLVHLEFILVIV